MKVKINNVNVEAVVKGKSRYSIATVEFTHNGEPKSRKIMSFANPTVFKQVQELVGQEVDVTIGKNDAGYDEWKAIDVGGSTSTSAPSAAPTTRVTGSNYETKEERAARQVLIVRQSSLSNAINLLKTEKVQPSVEDVLKTAQQMTDWVLDNNTDKEDDFPSDLGF